jgi:outer membrane lipopolysaccharide assembly protein LptE/RlpB
MPLHLQTMAVLPDNPYTSIQRNIRKALRQAHVHLVPSPTGVYSLTIDSDNLSRSVMIVGTDGQAKQEELIYALIYHLTPPGQDPLPQQVIRVQRILNVDYNRTLGQTLEESTLINEMHAEATAQLMRRLSVVHP